MFRKSSYITLDRERERATTTHLVDIRYSNKAKCITRKEAVTGMRAVVLRYDIRFFFTFSFTIVDLVDKLNIKISKYLST